MAKKVYIANPNLDNLEHRLVINVTNDYSVGVKLNLIELQEFYYEIQDYLNKHQQVKNTKIE